MPEIDEKPKRKQTPPRKYLSSALLVIIGFVAGILFTLAILDGVRQASLSEYEALSTQIRLTNHAVELQIAATQGAMTVIPAGLSEFEFLSTQIAATNAAVGMQIYQTQIASTPSP